ncbi:MAG: LysO family transporter [Thermoplasmata archaeon]
MEFDPFLYVAFGAGYLVGWRWRPTTPWILRATIATIIALVFLLGASLTDVSPATLAPSVALAIGFAALILVCTLAVYAALPHRPTAVPPRVVPRAPERIPLSVLLIGALFAGYGVALAVPIPAAAAIPYALYVLLALVGLGIQLQWETLRRVWVPVVAALAGALGAGLIYAFATGTSAAASWAISSGFGWYTLDGPLVSARLGASLGLVAFLANFLRENLTMVLAPVVGRRAKGEGLAAMGGATSMDTTLYFVVRYGDPDAGSLALGTGLILTVAASLLVPAFLLLPV